MFRKKYIHETTGDVLTFSEQISWKVQGIIRNWFFVVLWSGVTFVWWAEPTWFTDTHAYIKWMNLASWLAVTVELIIGVVCRSIMFLGSSIILLNAITHPVLLCEYMV